MKLKKPNPDPEIKDDVTGEKFTSGAQPSPSKLVGRRKANVVDHHVATNLRKVKF